MRVQSCFPVIWILSVIAGLCVADGHPKGGNHNDDVIITKILYVLSAANLTDSETGTNRRQPLQWKPFCQRRPDLCRISKFPEDDEKVVQFCNSFPNLCEEMLENSDGSRGERSIEVGARPTRKPVCHPYWCRMTKSLEPKKVRDQLESSAIEAKRCKNPAYCRMTKSMDASEVLEKNQQATMKSAGKPCKSRFDCRLTKAMTMEDHFKVDKNIQPRKRQDPILCDRHPELCDLGLADNPA